jgi:Domain of unknown function (DUF5615)
MRFFLDEDSADVIAEIARRAGVDIVSVRELGRDGLTDEEQLRYAGQNGRCVITRNRGDFARLSRRFEAEGLPHVGVALVPKSLRGEAFSAVAAAIIRFDAEHPDGVPPYSVWWLIPEPG